MTESSHAQSPPQSPPKVASSREAGETATHLVPLASLEDVERERLRASIRVVATDVDGTLTTDGALSLRVIQAIEALSERGIEVMPVSGRPAGEIQGLVRYLPGVRRGIAENGLLEVVPDEAPRWIDAPTDVARLRSVGERLEVRRATSLRVTADAYCRLGDVAYEREGRDEAELLGLRAAAQREGVYLTWSNVHVHLSERPPDKGAALTALLARGGVGGDSVLTVGDAPNDAGLFEVGRFRMSVGTADVLEHRTQFMHLPSHVAAAREGEAFVEVARLLGANLSQR